MPDDPLVAGQPTFQLLDHPILGDRDDGRGAGRKAVADLLQILILEALVAHLSPHPTGSPAHDRGGDDAGREDQADDAAGDRAALGHFLAAGISGLLEGDLVLGGVDDHRCIDQVD
jgi:hypothetical protein